MPFKRFAIGNKPKGFSFKCSCCDKVHEGGPSFSMDMPFGAFLIPKDEFDERVKLNSDLCIVDKTDFYIRATLSIPIQNSSEDFLWGVWVTQSKESFNRYVETFDADQSQESSFGWLPITFEGYARNPLDGPVENLKTSVYWGDSAKRPTVVFHDDVDHPMATDQRNGISWDRAIELAIGIMHPEQSTNAK